MPTGLLSLILYYSFTQTYSEVNPLNLDKRLNQGPILLFDIHQRRDCHPPSSPGEEADFFQGMSAGSSLTPVFESKGEQESGYQDT